MLECQTHSPDLKRPPQSPRGAYRDISLLVTRIFSVPVGTMAETDITLEPGILHVRDDNMLSKGQANSPTYMSCPVKRKTQTFSSAI